MILDFKRFCGYVCPVCMEASINQLNIFNFSGNNIVSIDCDNNDCQENCIDISTAGTKYKIETECPICGDNHTFNINKNTFWSRPLISLKCPLSGIDILFIGEHDRIVEALKKQQNIFDDTRIKQDDLSIVLEIIECINSFAEENRMYCECGSKNIRAIVSEKDITLACSSCNNRRVFEISIDTLSTLLNLNSIVLNNI